MSPLGVRFSTVETTQFPLVADLAHRIWPVCFAPIISPAQCDYMLRQRYTPEAIATAIADGMAYELIHVDDILVGFGAHGPAPAPSAWKLWQIYLLPDQQGHGCGRRYIEHVADAARRHGRSELLLTVNKRNERALRLYERCGFSIRESVTTDIGHGFIMDDFIMVRPLPRLPAGIAFTETPS